MRRGVLSTIIFISCLPILSATVISPSLPLITNYFGGGESVKFKVKLLIALPGLFTALGAPLAGWIIDAIGRKTILYIGLALYILAGAGSGLFLQNLTGILLGRIFLGLAIGILFTVGTTLIADHYEGHKRNQVMGLQTSFIAFTAILSLTLGGFLADFYWRLPFAVLLVAFIGFPLTLFCLQEEPKDEHSNYNLPRLSWLWKYKSLPIIYGSMCLTLMMFYLVPIEIPFVLTGLHISKQSTIGLILALFNIAAGASAMAYARVKSVLNFHQIFAFSYGCMGMGFLCISFARTSLGHTTLLSPLQAIILGLCFHGVGFGLTIPNASIWAQHVAPKALRGRVTSGLTTFIFLGQFTSPFLAQALSNLDSNMMLISPIFGSSSLICLLLSLFFLGFKARWHSA